MAVVKAPVKVVMAPVIVATFAVATNSTAIASASRSLAVAVRVNNALKLAKGVTTAAAAVLYTPVSSLSIVSIVLFATPTQVTGPVKVHPATIKDFSKSDLSRVSFLAK